MQHSKKALRKAFWSSLARSVGVLMTFSAGTALRTLIGDNMIVLAITGILGFFLMWLAEYVSEL